MNNFTDVPGRPHVSTWISLYTFINGKEGVGT